MAISLDTDARTDAALLDVRAVAALLNCSTRHVYRLADAGRMPAPTKLGALVRWRKKSILEWLDEGCPSCRKGGRP
ncbi:MAG: helix-turn-helix domain-containing protein [Planctomycetes bacterium]|nr:helix-turn-helix domain-containing protein [Planctomycetota bacterium]